MTYSQDNPGLDASGLMLPLSAAEEQVMTICHDAAAVSQSMADLCRQIDQTAVISMADLHQYIQQIHQWDGQLSDLEKALSAGRVNLLASEAPCSEQMMMALDAEMAGLRQESSHLTQVIGEIIACYEALQDETMMT